MSPRSRWGVGWCRDDAGQVTVFVVVALTGLVLLAGLVLDGGRALGAKVEAVSHAQSAARAGAQHLDLAAYRLNGMVRLDPAAAAEAARAYLGALDARGTVTATTDAVRVTVTAHSYPQLLGFVGLGPIEVTGTGTAHPVRSDTPGGGSP